MKEKCPWCLSESLVKLKEIVSWINDKKYVLWECKNCELQFFTPLKFEEIYSSEKCPDYKERHIGKKEIPEWTKEVVKFLKRKGISLENKKILEIGGGDCINFEAFKKVGCNEENYYVIEIDKKSVKVCKERGVIHIINKFFDRNLKINEKFDIIFCLEVLEHQTKPREFIEKTFSLLKKGGLLIITLPNRERAFLKEREKGDIPPHHFLRFNKKFFAKNFKEKIVYIKTFNFKNKPISLTAKRVSFKLTRKENFWPFFILFSIMIKIIDKIKGEGLLVVIKK